MWPRLGCGRGCSRGEFTNRNRQLPTWTRRPASWIGQAWTAAPRGEKRPDLAATEEHGGTRIRKGWPGRSYRRFRGSTRSHIGAAENGNLMWPRLGCGRGCSRGEFTNRNRQLPTWTRRPASWIGQAWTAAPRGEKRPDLAATKEHLGTRIGKGWPGRSRRRFRGSTRSHIGAAENSSLVGPRLQPHACLSGFGVSPGLRRASATPWIRLRKRRSSRSGPRAGRPRTPSPARSSRWRAPPPH